MNNEEYKTYNPHCSEWSKCERTLENDCTGCLNNKKGTNIVFNKMFNENFKKMINNLNKLTNNDWLTITKYNIMILNDFINGYYDFEDNECKFSIGNDCDSDYDGDCLHHYLKYYLKNMD